MLSEVAHDAGSTSDQFREALGTADLLDLDGLRRALRMVKVPAEPQRQPEIRGHAEDRLKAQRGVRRDPALEGRRHPFRGFV